MEAEKQKEFGAWIREHRILLGINQKEAGRRARISRTQWARLELGESGTRRENIPAIAKAVKADLHETYRKAGYAPPGRQIAVAFSEKFNDLPEHVQEDLTVQVEALWKKYTYQRKAR